MGRRAETCRWQTTAATGDASFPGHSRQMAGVHAGRPYEPRCFLEPVPGGGGTDAVGTDGRTHAQPGAPSLVTVLPYLRHRVVPQRLCFSPGHSEAHNTESGRLTEVVVGGDPVHPHVSAAALGLARVPMVPSWVARRTSMGAEGPGGSGQPPPCTAAQVRGRQEPVWPRVTRQSSVCSGLSPLASWEPRACLGHLGGSSPARGQEDSGGGTAQGRDSGGSEYGRVGLPPPVPSLLPLLPQPLRYFKPLRTKLSDTVPHCPQGERKAKGGPAVVGGHLPSATALEQVPGHPPSPDMPPGSWCPLRDRGSLQTQQAAPHPVVGRLFLSVSHPILSFPATQPPLLTPLRLPSFLTWHY